MFLEIEVTQSSPSPLQSVGSSSGELLADFRSNGLCLSRRKDCAVGAAER